MAKTNDEMDDLYNSTVEVHKKDGSVSPLASKPKPKMVAVPKSGAKKPAPRGDAVAARVMARLVAEKEASRIKEQARIEATDIRLKAKLAAKKDTDKAAAVAKEKAALAKKAMVEAKAKATAERNAVNAEARRKMIDDRKAARAAVRAETAAAKLRAVGETGDPEADAAFHKAVDEAKALAVSPLNTGAMNLPFLSRAGVSLTDVGLVLPVGLPLLEWVQAIGALTGLGSLSAFAVGDALIFGEAEYGKQYKVARAALNLAASTVYDFTLVARTFPLEARVQGASPTHHLEVASLYKTHPAMAINLLQEAVADRQPATWVRSQVKEMRAGEIGAPTAKQQAQDKKDALVLASNAQREADMGAFGNPEQVEAAVRVEINALLDYAQRNMEVPAVAVLRNVARLQVQIDNALGDVQLWKERALLAESKLLALGEAIPHPIGSVATVYNGTSELPGFLEDEDDLAFLNVPTS